MLYHDSLLADLETRSRVDLESAGARRYSMDPSTQITTACWLYCGILKTACTVHPHLGCLLYTSPSPRDS